MKIENRRYLGDGVYVSTNGDNIEIAVNHHNNLVVVLEPEVAKVLQDYMEEIKLLRNKKN